MFAQFSKCLYCIWPALVIGVGWFLSRAVETKTYYGSLTPGVDPVSPQGQAEFETRRQRDAEKRKIIYWAVGIIAVGYLAALGFNTFTLRAAADQSTVTPTRMNTPTPTQTEPTLTFTQTLPSMTPSCTLGTRTPTYVPTATDRIVYLAGPKSTVIVTVLVPVTVIVTATFTRSATYTRTPKPTRTSTLTWTPNPTGTPTPTWTDTPLSTP